MSAARPHSTVWRRSIQNPHVSKQPSNNRLGILYMSGGMFLFSAVDTIAKFLTETLHPLQIVWSRQLGLLIGILMILALRGGVILRTRRPGLQVARGAMAAGSATLFVIAVSYVPLADAVAVTFVAPFLVTMIGALVLRETVGIRRWTAVALGFVGVLIVTRPGLGVVHPAVFLVLLAALMFALRQVISRVVARTDPIVTTVAYTALVSSAILTVPLPFVWQPLTTGLELGLLIGMAVLAAFAETW